ncbi:hypothetical protein B0181_00385 [Moraxella caviae]|uniref:Protein of uncharacterized function (DUF2799) n=1 Tax=Moraxella caviae TaxID=34060 RepID=A0A1T0ACJ2_9GAMM|nr:DUF2799 domain-containing protein [Moraxella caviae]OOR93436.1 hypothetical protein B0181_00385 [Moraxella caviae]STZ14095.1 Protein of uncharacterised function (DUF2799) [Moraxella caviae]
MTSKFSSHNQSALLAKSCTNSPKILLAAAFGVLTLAGCATTSAPRISSTDCPSLNWQTLGEADGAVGHSAQRILHYQKLCASTDITPNRAEWEAGRQKGLTQYCTKETAYNLGRMGRELTGVCEQNLDELHHANMMGLEQYEMGERLRRFDYPYYPYGSMYRNPFWHDPWFAPVPYYAPFYAPRR